MFTIPEIRRIFMLLQTSFHVHDTRVQKNVHAFTNFFPCSRYQSLEEYSCFYKLLSMFTIPEFRRIFMHLQTSFHVHDTRVQKNIHAFTNFFPCSRYQSLEEYSCFYKLLFMFTIPEFRRIFMLLQTSFHVHDTRVQKNIHAFTNFMHSMFTIPEFIRIFMLLQTSFHVHDTRVQKNDSCFYKLLSMFTIPEFIRIFMLFPSTNFFPCSRYQSLEEYSCFYKLLSMFTIPEFRRIFMLLQTSFHVHDTRVYKNIHAFTNFFPCSRYQSLEEYSCFYKLLFMFTIPEFRRIFMLLQTSFHVHDTRVQKNIHAFTNFLPCSRYQCL